MCTTWATNMGPTHISACTFQTLWPHLIISGPQSDRLWQIVWYKNYFIIFIIFTMKAHLKWIQTTCFCSRTSRRLTHPNIIRYLESENSLLSSLSCASKQSILELGRLCNVGSPAAATALRWLFETVEQLIQAIVDEFRSSLITVSMNGDDIWNV